MLKEKGQGEGGGRGGVRFQNSSVKLSKDANLMAKYFNHLKIIKIKIMIIMLKNNDREINKKVYEVDQDLCNFHRRDTKITQETPSQRAVNVRNVSRELPDMPQKIEIVLSLSYFASNFQLIANVTKNSILHVARVIDTLLVNLTV